MCEYCNEDYDGWYKPLDKNGHLCIFDTPHKKYIDVSWYGHKMQIDIKYCPMCRKEVRRLTMSKADKMFEELGYRKAKRHVAYIKEQDFILFINKKQGVCIHKEGSEYPAFTMQELQAINEKVKELGW